MKKLFLMALTGAVVAQIWGMISWMALPWHNIDTQGFNNEAAISETLRSEAPKAGVYFLPYMGMAEGGDQATMDEWNRKAKEGPYAFAVVQPNGIHANMGIGMGVGFLINFLVALMFSWLLGMLKIDCPKGRTVFVMVAVATGGLFVHGSYWNWWHFPTAFSLINLSDLVIQWGLAGFAMVKVSDKVKA